MNRFVAAVCLISSAAFAGGIQVELASVTLTEPCVITKSEATSAQKSKRAVGAKADMAGDVDRPLCDRTSMQLAVAADEAGELAIKSVELFDDKGALLSVLTWQAPTAWVDGVYRPWDQKVAAGQKLNVSYPLSQAPMGVDRYNRGYVLKVTVTVGGKDQGLQKSVTLRRETVMPANAKT